MTDIESKLRSNIWKYYLHEIFAGMFFSIPVIVLFWQNNGLTLTEVMILQSIFAMNPPNTLDIANAIIPTKSVLPQMRL